MYKILTLNNISVAGLDRLPRDKYEVASEISHPDAILVRSAKMHDMTLPESLKAIGRAGAGVNNIPVDAMTKAEAEGADLLMIDTAGRQHTRKGLMAELAKIQRIVAKLIPEAPHETWLVVDGSSGSNGLTVSSGCGDSSKYSPNRRLDRSFRAYDAPAR